MQYIQIVIQLLRGIQPPFDGGTNSALQIIATRLHSDNEQASLLPLRGGGLGGDFFFLSPPALPFLCFMVAPCQEYGNHRAIKQTARPSLACRATGLFNPPMSAATPPFNSRRTLCKNSTRTCPSGSLSPWLHCYFFITAKKHRTGVTPYPTTNFSKKWTAGFFPRSP